MKKRLFQMCLLFLWLVLLLPQAFADSKTAVKIDAQIAEGDFVGKRLLARIKEGIARSDTLKNVCETDTMLLVEMITVKIKNRPSCAYSYIVTYNAYGKLSPVLAHRIGVCGNTRVNGVAQEIVATLAKISEQVRSKLKKPEG